MTTPAQYADPAGEPADLSASAAASADLPPHWLADAPDATLRPVRQAVQQALMGLVRGYQLFFSPWLGSSCRFEPTCSHYALQALAAHGAARGSLLAARRLLRCHPWCDGGLDPVPPPRGAAPSPSSTDPTP